MRPQTLAAVSRRIMDPLDCLLDEAEGYLMLGLPRPAGRLLESRPLWTARRARWAFLKGWMLKRQGDLRAAVALLEEAIRLDPGQVEAGLMLAWCHRRTHRLAQAIDGLESLKPIAPISARLRYNLACYWSLACCPRKAVAELETALAFRPHWIGRALRDPDFDPIRHDPHFLRVIPFAPPACDTPLVNLKSNVMGTDH
mgnify:CR=1 FL=1